MNPVAASAATAAYQIGQRRNDARLQPVPEHPWERNQSYFDELRKPASADAFRSPPWRQNRQDLSKTIPNGPTPTQRLDLILNGPLSTRGLSDLPPGMSHDNPHDSRQLAVIPQRDRRSNGPNRSHGQQLVRRKPTQQQLRVSNRRQDHGDRPQASQFRPYGPPPPLTRNHVPQDLVQGALALREAGIALPSQGEQALAPRARPQLREPAHARPASGTMTRSRDVSLKAYELPGQAENVNPIPKDLRESMGRLRFHDMSHLERVEGVMELSEMPDSTTAELAGSNYELLAVADEIVEDRIPHSRIALAGLSGSG